MFNKTFLIGLVLAPVIYFSYSYMDGMTSKAPVEQAVEETNKPTLLDINFVPAKGEKAVPTQELCELSVEDKDFKNNLSLTEFKGKPTIVHLWAPWCGACVGEMDSFDEFTKAAGDKVNVVAISTDRQGGTSLRDFFKEHDLKSLKLYMDPTGQLSRALGTRALPTTIMFDAKGNEVGRIIGPVEWKEYGDLIRKKLKAL